MSNLKKLGKDSAVYGFGTVLKKFIGILLLPFYTRALSPSEYGILDTLVTFGFFTSVILSLGLVGATSRYYFIADTEKEKGQVLYTSLIIRIFSYSIPLFFLIYFSNNISELLFKTDEYKYVVAISLATIFITAMFEIQSIIFRYNREAWKFTLVNIIRAIITPIAGILLVVILKLGVFGATLSSFITSTIILIFAFFYYTRKKYTRDFSKYWAKKMLKFGFPLIFTGILVWVNSVSDRFFLLHYSTLEQIGLYSIGNTFAQPISLINMALTMSATVLVFSLYNDEQDENKPKTKAFLTKIWYSYLFISITIATLISIFSYDIVNFITTPKYIEGILAIPFLMFSLIIYQSSQITGNGMTIKEQSKQYFWIMLIGSGTNVILNFYFVPKFGFVGAAFTTVTSNSVYFIIAYFWSQKYFYIKRSFVLPMGYFFIALGISLFFPFARLKFNLDISVWVKILVFLISLTLPFIFKVMKIQMAKSYTLEFWKILKKRN